MQSSTRPAAARWIALTLGLAAAPALAACNKGTPPAPPAAPAVTPAANNGAAPAAPAAVALAARPERLSLGTEGSCLLSGTHSLRCWGGGDARRGSGVTDVAQVTLGRQNGGGCAVMMDGTVRCWGGNAFGQLGTGNTTAVYTGTTQVPGLTNVAEVAVGQNHACARLADGGVRCWGYNSDGQVGNGTTENALSPVPVQGLAGVAQLATGQSTTCARLTNGTVRCWGGNSHGSLGNDQTGVRSPAPTEVGGVAGAVEIAGGGEYYCARLGDGGVRCWGYNNEGQLGDGTTQDHATATPVPAIANAAGIALGNRHSCARFNDGTVRCWGRNDHGQLGDNTTVNRGTPAPVPGITTAVGLASGMNHTCALLVDGAVRCWGSNSGGGVTSGTSREDQRIPFVVSL